MKKAKIPPQSQSQPGREAKMHPQPEIIRDGYKGSDKLKGRTALITGGDSGIGRAVAVHYAREGANVAIVYLKEDEDAEKTAELVEQEGAECLLLRGDLRKTKFCNVCVQKTISEFGRLNILINNAAEQHVHQGIREMDMDLMEKTFRTNIISTIYVTRAAVDHLRRGDSVIFSASIVAYEGRKYLMDYGATKGAIVGFMRSLNDELVAKGIRVNAVAPGPIWTPLIPASFGRKHVAEFGQNTPMGRPGQPSEVAPAYVFLASRDASYISGQVIHVNGGTPAGS